MEQPPVRAKDFWYDKHGKIRIMATADGYAMCRRPGLMVFVKDIKFIRANWIHQDNIEIMEP